MTGEDNKYMMNHIYLGLVYPERNMTLDRNGGSGGTSSIRAMYRTAIMQESITVPTRTGYRFAGYEYNDSLVYNSSGVLQTNTTYGGNPIYLWNTISGTLTAQWTPNTYSVTFYRNTSLSDNTISTQSGFTYDQSKALQAKPTDWTKEGYRFIGWSTSRTATTATYTNGQSVENLTTSGTVNLYAVWALNSYTLTIDPNGGTYNGKTGSQAVSGLYTQTTTIAAPTRYGYNFAGWAISGGNGSLSTFGKVCSASTDPLFTTQQQQCWNV